MSANARLVLILVAVAAVASLLLVGWAFHGEPPSITSPSQPPLICPELASRIRWTSDQLDRAALEREYDRRCPDSPPPTSLDR